MNYYLPFDYSMAQLVVNAQKKKGLVFQEINSSQEIVYGKSKERLFFGKDQYWMEDPQGQRIVEINRTAKFPSSKRPLGNEIIKNTKYEFWWKESIFKSSYRVSSDQQEFFIYDHIFHNRSIWKENNQVGKIEKQHIPGFYYKETVLTFENDLDSLVMAAIYYFLYIKDTYNSTSYNAGQLIPAYQDIYNPNWEPSNGF